MSLTPQRIRSLVAAAKKGQSRAYAPYSKFKVGAAILTAADKVYTGTNVENASYGLTICAERAALTRAISDGQQRFKAIVIVAPSPRPTPCGACRQVLAEFGEMDVICVDSRKRGKRRTYRLADLLPERFVL